MVYYANTRVSACQEWGPIMMHQNALLLLLLQEYAIAEQNTNLPRLADNMLMEVEPKELKLIAALFESNTGRAKHAHNQRPALDS